jgi:hypothetical protein
MSRRTPVFTLFLALAALVAAALTSDTVQAAAGAALRGEAAAV